MSIDFLSKEERTKCEVWNRISGYFRPITCANAGKQSEYKERVRFKLPAELVSSSSKSS